jgi:hypothetical protein
MKAADLRLSSNCAASMLSRWNALLDASAARPRLSTVRSTALRAASLMRWTAASSAAGRR